MKSEEEIVQELRARIDLLRRCIEQDDVLVRRYEVIAKTLRALYDTLSNRPIDAKKLSGEALGIIRVLDGPLHNQTEEELFELAGDIGLLVRGLKHAS